MKQATARICIGLLCLSTIAACSSRKTVERPQGVAPPPAVTGPDHFKGTVGSLCRIRGYSATLVSGYGLVALPQGSGTGSAEVPAYLRQWMLQEMRRRGFGTARYGMQNLTAESFFASKDTAVVAIQGLIPPGAKRGTRFDLLVTALPATQTTSLQGGTLFTADLSVGGLDRSMVFRRPLARGGGETYVNPLAPDTESEEVVQFNREAVVLAGGIVLEDRPLELVLNASSWTRSRAIADRINERFPAAPGSKKKTAEPATDRLIRISVSDQYASDPSEFLRLVSKVYLQRVTGFEQAKARELMTIALNDPAARGDAHYALISLGKIITPILRAEYDHPDLDYRLLMLRTGVRLDDGQAILDLAELADHPDPSFRVEVIEALSYAPRNRRSERVLAKRLQDDVAEVRIAAYETLVKSGNPLVHREPIGDGHKIRFMLDLIRSDQPMVFIAQRDLPRIVIFGANVPFETPMFAEFKDGRLMMRAMEEGEPASVFFQPRGGGESQTFEIAPTVGNLAFLLGHKANPRNTVEGLDLSYSDTVHTIYQLHLDGVIPGSLELQLSPLAQTIATVEDDADAVPETRPETQNDPQVTDASTNDGGQESRPETADQPATSDGPFIPLDRSNQPSDTVPSSEADPTDGDAESRPEVGF